MIRRREFIAGLGYAAAWPVVGRAQQAAMPLVGWLGIGSSPNAEAITAVKQGLAETGFVEGRNFAFEYREAGYQYDRPPALAADLVRRRVAVIVTGGIEATLAAKAATTTIPIVFATGADPVAVGLVASLNRPGANVTGIATLQAELGPKRLQLLRELIPNAARFGVLADANPGIPSVITDLQAAARTLGLELVVAITSTDSDREAAFATFSQQRVGAVLAYTGAQLAALAARHALPAMFLSRVFVLAGGLMS